MSAPSALSAEAFVAMSKLQLLWFVIVVATSFWLFWLPLRMLLAIAATFVQWVLNTPQRIADAVVDPATEATYAALTQPRATWQRVAVRAGQVWSRLKGGAR